MRYPISRIPLSRLYPVYPPYPSIRSIVSRSPRDVNVSRVGFSYVSVRVFNLVVVSL